MISGGLVRRLTFNRCVLPDAVVACVCRALLQGGSTGVPLIAVCFEECGLSEQAEQQLLVTLEQCDSRCLVTIDGGLARPHVEDGPCKPADARVLEMPVKRKQKKASAVAPAVKSDAQLAVEVSQRPPPKSPEEAMPLQEMLAMALLRLQEERGRLQAEQGRGSADSDGLSPRPVEVASSSRGPALSSSLFEEELNFSFSDDLPMGLRDCEDVPQIGSQARCSRFGFALDDTP